MRNIILYIGILFLSISCNQNKVKQDERVIQNPEIKDTKEEQGIEPLAEGEVHLTNDAFGAIIELKGISKPVDRIFKVSEIEMIAKGSFLIVKNKNEDFLFMAFSLPEFRYIKSFGRRGNGPGEFQFPSLVKTAEKNVLCYIFERAHNKLYSLNKSFEIIELPLQMSSTQREFSDKQLYAFSDSNFIYTESIKGGKAVFHLQANVDSISNTRIHNLSFSKKHNNWAAYIGDFGASKNNQRIVFAYKYFKRLTFMDIEGEKTRTLIFEEKEAKTGDAINMLGPDNVTHYWGMSAQNNYLYILYSGRTPIEVSKELNKSQGFIYVEQFDWNGNPIRKFKLDHWGYFCINEAENVIYLASTTKEHPFLRYKIPED